MADSFDQGDGGASVTRLGDGALSTELRGHLRESHARWTIGRLASLLAPGDMIFVDTSPMVRYDPEARRLITQWLLGHRREIVAVHLLVRSKLVKMGVSVANLALKGLIHTYTDPDEWAAAQRDAAPR